VAGWELICMRRRDRALIRLGGHDYGACRTYPMLDRSMERGQMGRSMQVAKTRTGSVCSIYVLDRRATPRFVRDVQQV
jgi:hypothetical protein